MKKIVVGIAVITLVVLLMSCASAAVAASAPPQSPAEPEPVEQPMVPQEYTQAHADSDFAQAYNAYRAKIIMTGSKGYIVVRGDYLVKITVEHYGRGTGFYFPLIMLASSEEVLDPDLIEPGMNFVIPDLQRNLENLDSRSAIKSFLLDIAAIYRKKGRQRDFETEEGLIQLSRSL